MIWFKSFVRAVEAHDQPMTSFKAKLKISKIIQGIQGRRVVHVTRIYLIFTKLNWFENIYTLYVYARALEIVQAVDLYCVRFSLKEDLLE